MPSEDRSSIARIAAFSRWGKEPDRSAATAAARTAFADKFLHEADPDGVLPYAERVKRAQSLRRAYFQRLALASARARRRGQA